jgi:DNA mismatch repair protein MutS
MFATHYHELTELALEKPGIANYQIAVREWNGQVIFLRRLLPGAISRSYGIQVGRLAGLPEQVIARATQVLANLEEGELDATGHPRIGTTHGTATSAHDAAQFQLFTAAPSEVEQRLREVDPDAVTPLQALNVLHELVRLVKR